MPGGFNAFTVKSHLPKSWGQGLHIPMVSSFLLPPLSPPSALPLRPRLKLDLMVLLPSMLNSLAFTLQHPEWKPLAVGMEGQPSIAKSS
jgi:hypothetical protein